MFYYLDMLRNADDATFADVNQQVIDLGALRFNFRNKPQPFNYCTSLTSGMQEYDNRNLLQALYGVPGVGVGVAGGVVGSGWEVGRVLDARTRVLWARHRKWWL